MRSRVAIAALLILAAAAPATRAADTVTIYRCTDAAGHLTVRDTPCPKNQKQQTRTMLRPKDAPAARRIAPASTPVRARPIYAPEQSQPSRYLAPLRPMYECTTADGERYTSDNAEGNPRWVPLWTLGYPFGYMPGYPQRHPPGYPGPHPHPHPRAIDRAGLSITSGGVQIDGQRTVLHPPLFYGGGYTWVVDDCHELPRDDMCARLIDRRDAIRTRFFNAMPSERDQLRVEERGINARLDNDCGGH
jgi:hypothetical protein